MKLRTLLFFQLLPLFVLLIIVIVALVVQVSTIDIHNDGEAALGVVGSFLLYPTVFIAFFFFQLILPGFLIVIEIVVRRKLSDLLNKSNIIAVYTIVAIIEGLWLGLAANVAGSLLNLYIFVFYLLYRYKSSNFVVNGELVKEKFQKAYLVRVIILIIVTLTVSYYFQEYNRTYPQIEIELFK